MLKHAMLICCVLVLLVTTAKTQRNVSPNSPKPAPQQTVPSGAEAVFAKSASKVVFLIARKSGKPHILASGVILSADGYIATNYHALQGADTVEIRFFPDPANSDDYRSFNTPKLLYADPDNDIAILKVGSNSLPFLQCGMGCTARVGQKVYAIGNPKGLSNTISEGIVSALRATDSEDVIQHTAAISPGSSGGALVDLKGDLLGMNSWLVADGQNLNFAISANNLLQALTAARRARNPLSFPPAEPDDRPAQQSQAQETDWQASQPAVEALRAIAETIRSCPQFSSDKDQWGKRATEFRQYRAGPPRNVVWDIAPRDSVRAPYSGFVEFTIAFSVYIPLESFAKFMREHSGLYSVFQSVKPQEYRYEFDVGPSGLVLTKVLSRDEGQTDWQSGELPNYCWGQAARISQSASDKGVVLPVPLASATKQVKTQENALDDCLSRLTSARERWESLTNNDGLPFKQWQAQVLRAKPALDQMHAEWQTIRNTIERYPVPQQCRIAADRFVVAFDRYLSVQDKLFAVYVSVDPEAPDAQRAWASANADYQELLKQQEVVLEDLNTKGPAMTAGCKGTPLE
jgi:serine protease Do